jgi:molecular chaperone DnaK (HSP70)
MAIGVDFGTMFLVVAKNDENGKMTIANERNCFYDVSIDSEEMLMNSDYKYIKDTENGEEKLFIVGKDALKLANLFAKNSKSGERKSGLRRPMQKMVLNSSMDKKAIQMLKYISQALAGKPAKEGEVAVISVPANPVDDNFNNVFHSNMCQNFIRELGYEVYPINEALAVVYASNPKTTDEDGEVLNMTGIGISWGAGGTNGCLAYKGQETIKFAVPRGGDWIDEETSKICQMSASEVTIAKEKASKEGKLDLSKPCYDDEIVAGLYFYYKELVTSVIKQFKQEFIKAGTHFTDPIEVVVSGGTSKPNGFEKLVEDVIKEVSWPFEIQCVRRANNALAATAIGCLNAAQSREKKK